MTPAMRGWRAWTMAILLFALLALPSPRRAGSNVMARFGAAVQLVEHGDLSLGPYARLTNDAAIYNGRAYNDKAPGVTLLVAPVYALVRGAATDFAAALRWTRTLSLTLLTLFTVWFFRRRLPAWGADGALADVAAVGFAVGAVTWPYFTMLYSHGFAADFVLLGVLLLAGYRRDPAHARPLWLGGLAFGLAIACEYPTAVLALAAGVYLLSFERRPARLAGFVALGALLPLAIIGGVNWACFGSPWNFGYLFEKDAVFKAQHTNGLMGFGAPTFATLSLLLVSPAKGLFFWSPVLMVGVAGFGAMLRARLREGWLLAGMAAAYAVLFAGYFEAGGGACLGPRHLAPIVGPLILAGAWFAARRPDARGGAFFGLTVASSLVVAAGVFVDPQMPDRLANPLWDFAAPMLAAGVGPGNFLGVSDRAASVLGFALLFALWLVVALGFRGDTMAAPRRKIAAALTILLTLGFYLGVAPKLPRTEPGLLHQIKGNHFSAREEYARAAHEYEEAAAIRRDPWILYYLARTYVSAGDNERALDAWRRLLEIDPGFRPPGAEAVPPDAAAAPALPGAAP
jgi:hypothetical protein